MNLLILSIVLCLIAGAAVDTGSVCVVRAVNEAIAGRATLALGVLSTLLAASLVFFIDTTMHWHLRQAPWAWPSLVTIVGAAVFSIGAVVNGACAMGTVTRLCRGDIGYLATIIGALAFTMMVPRPMLPSLPPGEGATMGLQWLTIVALFVLVPMLILRQHISGRIILSYTVMGLIAAVLANLRGDWTWLRLFQTIQAGVPIRIEAIAGIAAVLVGATTMAMFRGHFKLTRPQPRKMAREAIGGGLMAAGAVMIPGGNDVLLIYGLPSGSPHAIVAYILIVTMLVLLLRGKDVVRPWLVWPRP
jgi:uncharacterized protein